MAVRLAIVLITVIAVTGCAGRQPSPAPGAALAWERLASASYAGVRAQSVTLRGGRWEGEPFVPGGASRPRIELLDLMARGDLDGDGREDAVVLLGEHGGGTGSQIFLAAVAERRGAPVNVGTAMLGDRVQVRALAIEAGRAVVDLVTHGPADPMCCPTRNARRVFAVRAGVLTEVSREERGPVSPADFEGTTWRLVGFAPGEPAPAVPRVTAQFGAGGIRGFGGCNSYGAALKAQAPGRLAIGPIQSTRRACPDQEMKIEDRYLAALGKVEQHSWWLGRLALTYARPGGVGTLLFVPAISSSPFSP